MNNCVTSRADSELVVVVLSLHRSIGRLVIVMVVVQHELGQRAVYVVTEERMLVMAQRKNKVAGITSDEKALKEQIYQRYISAYKKGVFNLIKEEPGRTTGEVVPLTTAMSPRASGVWRSATWVSAPPTIKTAPAAM